MDERLLRKRLRVLASGSFLDIELCRLSCQSAVVRGGQQRAQRGNSRRRLADRKADMQKKLEFTGDSQRMKRRLSVIVL